MTLSESHPPQPPSRRGRRMVGEPLLYAISIFSSLGVFLFGYDQGVMSGIITGPYFKTYFDSPTSYEIGTMVAILEIGAFITSIAAGRIGDIFGRKKTLFAGAIIFSIGGAIQTASTGFRSMIFGRIIAGFGVGFLSMIVPVYQSEISPAENRGKLACIEFTGNITGYAASVWIDYFCSFINGDASWRLPLSVQCVIGAILAFGSVLIPESPRWLLDTDQDESGMIVLADLHGAGDPTSYHARKEFEEIKNNIYADRQFGSRSYLAMWKRYRYRVIIGCSAMAFAQLNGINVISYYAPLVFEQGGWVGRDAILMTGINGIVYVLSTVPTWYLVDLWGRRFILLSGAILMGVCLTLIGWFMYLDTSYTPLAVVISVITYNAAFGYSWGPIPWLYPPEILPLAFRVKGVSISTATNWFFNYVVGEATPILQDAIRWRLYPMHAMFCAISFLLVFFAYPETKGVTLEAMDDLFGDQDRDEDDDEDDYSEDEDDDQEYEDSDDDSDNQRDPERSALVRAQSRSNSRSKSSSINGSTPINAHAPNPALSGTGEEGLTNSTNGGHYMTTAQQQQNELTSNSNTTPPRTNRRNSRGFLSWLRGGNNRNNSNSNNNSNNTEGNYQRVGNNDFE